MNYFKRLEPHLHYWTNFKSVGHFPDPSADAMRTITDVWKQHFNKTDYDVSKSLSCGGCIKDMLRQIFNAYEDYIKQQNNGQKKRS